MNAPFKPVEYPSDSVIKRHAAERDARDRWYAKWRRIDAELQTELNDIDRRFWKGEFAK